ncbi:MAG: protein-glutamate O-methyltransferase CheR [Candidatus Krumholzibacteriota bacterium]|nr:protein-glutamate O-methyltransferase CheR [Candidatus Krumholzibacteriota bacterium]
MQIELDIQNFNELIRLVKSSLGVDFSKYRPSCLQRRVLHRMSMLGMNDLEIYLAHASENPPELEKLTDTVTIHVTDFFRDEDVFESFVQTHLPRLVERKLSGGQKEIRIWSAGCSTGEETYSMAILIDHWIKKQMLEISLEAYGTDISEDSCRIARAGIYSREKVERVPSHIKSQYFDRQGAAFRVKGETMKRVKFNQHNLFTPSPFSMLDLVVCRNVLIHFKQEVRNDILSHFHSSLNENGILILGKSEAVMGRGLDLFRLIDPRSKTYGKINARDCSEEDRNVEF